MTDEELDRRTDAAIAEVPDPRPDPLYPVLNRDAVPLAWDLTRFWIWMDPGAGDDVEAATRAVKYTGE